VPPAKRGSGEVSLKDIDKLDKVRRQLKDLKKDSTLNSTAARTISELENAAEKAQSHSSDDEDTKH